GCPVTQIGTQVDAEADDIAVDRTPIQRVFELSYLMLNKPAGYVTTARDPQRRSTVMDLLPARVSGRVHPVGRLDRNTEGLLLFTNDGQLAYRLTHPRYQVEKEYFAEVEGRPSLKVLSRLH